MSVARIIQIAEAVKVTLAAATLSQSFTPTRKYLPRYIVKDKPGLLVTVLPFGLKSDQETRATIDDETKVQIGIEKKLDADDTTAADALMLLMQEIAGVFEGKQLANYGSYATCSRVEYPAIYSADDLERNGVFVSVITLTFNESR